MFFSIVYVIDATCFDKCFLFHVIAGRRYFSWKFVVTVRFFQPPHCRFLSNKCFERSPYFTHLHNNSAVLILNAKFQKKATVYYTYIYLKNFCSWLFYGNVFYTLYFFNCSTLFFIKLSFFEKLKTSLKACSYIIL